MTVPLARTPAEAHLYMDISPCACGETQLARDSTLLASGDDMLRQYAGACPRCGAAREFLFRLPAMPTPSSPGRVSFGGDEPSELLDPGQWLWVAEAYADLHPADPADFAPGEAQRARADLEYALAAVDEVVKFVPAGAQAVPESAFRSERGRAAYQREPYRFGLAVLVAVRDTYRDLLGRLDPGVR